MIFFASAFNTGSATAVRSRSKLFYRLLEQAVAVEPVPYRSLVKCCAEPEFRKPQDIGVTESDKYPSLSNISRHSSQPSDVGLECGLLYVRFRAAGARAMPPFMCAGGWTDNLFSNNLVIGMAIL